MCRSAVKKQNHVHVITYDQCLFGRSDMFKPMTNLNWEIVNEAVYFISGHLWFAYCSKRDIYMSLPVPK